MSKSEAENSQTLNASRDELILLLCTEFESAEKLTKSVEEFRDEAGLPAINELRYAGKHAVNFVAAEVSGKVADLGQIISAINHCKRAAYEAGEAGILTALSVVARFKDSYTDVTISDVVTNWVDILKRCDEIRDLLTRNRIPGPDRSADHHMYSDFFGELQSYCRTLEYSRDEMNKKVEKLQSDAQKFFLTVVITCVLAVIGFSLSIALGVLPYFFGG